MCVGDALLSYNGARSTRWTVDGRSLADIINAQPPLKDFLNDQRIGTLKPASPVRVATGTSDSLAPHAQARRLAALLTDQGDAIDWLTDRLNGKQTTSNCAILSLRP
jgi:acetyl esterase/lipase